MIVARRVALERAGLKELGALTPPPAIAEDWRRLLALRHTIVKDLEKLAVDAQMGNTAGERAVLASSTDIEQRMTVPAEHAGVKVCSRVI
jgi:hypothetical protein